MGLWDAVSGKICRWNAVITEANSLICPRLHRFVVSRWDEYPKLRELLLWTRNYLYAYAFAAGCGVGRDLDGPLLPFKDALLGLNSHRFMYFLAALHSYSAFHNFSDNRNTAGLVFDGICEMYGLSYNYAREWTACFEEPQDYNSTATASKLTREVSTALGTPNNPDFFIFWPHYSVHITRMAREILEADDWPDSVTAEIEACLRNS